MRKVSIVTQSSRGQIAIPAGIRAALNLQDGTKYAVYTSGDAIILKPISIPTEEDFRKIMAEARIAAEEVCLPTEAIDSAIKEVRERKRK